MLITFDSIIYINLKLLQVIYQTNKIVLNVKKINMTLFFQNGAKTPPSLKLCQLWRVIAPQDFIFT